MRKVLLQRTVAIITVFCLGAVLLFAVFRVWLT
jgi:hypothetical protein